MNYIGYCNSGIETVMVQASEKEILEVTFCQNKQWVERRNHLVDEAIRQLDEYFEGRRFTFDLPLRMEGTEFQIACLKAMLEIPYGTTISYLDEARRIGREKAVRAVGNANRNNKIGIIIPCHRVIGSSGKLVGYAGRLDLKAWLLEHEKRNRIVMF